VSVFDDGSTDGSAAKIAGWAERFRAAGWGWESSRGHPNRGEGHARNRAVRQSRGQYICVMDADDMMAPCRIARQLQAAKRQPDAIIGGGFRREPEDATWHCVGERAVARAAPIAAVPRSHDASSHLVSFARCV
jgi:glycosyltransferase involved in cell wall biosynthesis